MSDRYNGKETWEEWSKEWKLEDRYNFKTIEKKWQNIWDKEKAYKVEPDPDKEKFYALVEFPYPVRRRTSCRASALIHRFGRYFPQEKNAGF